MERTKPMKPQKRIVVVGAAGRLGTSLVQELNREHTVIPLTRKELDLSSIHSIERALETLDYESLIITGALTAVDHCETNEKEAYSINADGPGKIAEISANKGAHVTYISTDFVYDGGRDSSYVETDPASPICVYGASKLRGEENVLSASSKNLVVRVSWLFGRGKPAFPEWIIQKSCAESEVTLPYDKIGCPTSCEDLIEAILTLLCNPMSETAGGIFNFCNLGPCTWQEWGQFCIDTAKQAGLPILGKTIRGISMATVPAFIAKRPLNSAMCVNKFVEFAGYTPRSWQEAVREHLLSGNLFREYTSTRKSAV